MKLKLLFVFLIVNILILSQSPVPPNAVAVKIADGFQFVEGPVWKDGVGLLFSDINGNKVYKWTEQSGTSVYLSPSGNSNGLALDAAGHLLLAQHGNRRVARLEANNSQTSLASTYKGKKLNSPNDLTLRSDGSIYFTDPPYGIQPGQSELGYSGIFRVRQNGTLQLLDTSLYRPNGIAFSPDETKLYVGDAEARRIYVWDVAGDTILNKRQFAYMPPAGYTDGMKTDPNGYLFSAGPLGIWVFKPDGTCVDTILVPGQVTNCGWGDSDRKTLYITSGSAVYRIRIGEPTGVMEPNKVKFSFQLHEAYPNPFNPITIISYTLNGMGYQKVIINIYNVLGNKITTLVNADQLPGKHRVSFDATNLPSGSYFYEVIFRESRQIKKLLLLK